MSAFDIGRRLDTIGFPLGQPGMVLDKSISHGGQHPRCPRGTHLGATGFDMVRLNRGAGRGLLATLNRGKVKLIGKKSYQSAPALAMAA